MYGHYPRACSSGGGRGRGEDKNPMVHMQNPLYFHPFDPHFSNPNFMNPNLPFHNPAFQIPHLPFHNPSFQNVELPVQNPVFENSNVPFQNPNTQFPNAQRQNTLSKSRKTISIEWIDSAVTKARRDAVGMGENISAWKVSQSALLILGADTWKSLGYQMQEVPSLHRLMVTEGKINSFIHCFVGAMGITSMYELEVSICKNEGVEQFEVLELGPFVRHPLIVRYFSLGSDASKVFKITSEEIISHLIKFLDNKKSRIVNLTKFLNFLAGQYPVTKSEQLGVRIQNMEFLVTSILQVKNEDFLTMKKCFDSLKRTSKKKNKKRPLFSSQKKEVDARYSAISQRIINFSSAHEKFSGKRIQFPSPYLQEDGESDDYEYVDKQDSYQKSPMQNISCDNVSSCPYPSTTEEMVRLGLEPSSTGSIWDNESCVPLKNKRKKLERCTQTPIISKKCKTMKNLPTEIGCEFEDLMSTLGEFPDLGIDSGAFQIFITTWKEACRVHDVKKVFLKMIQFYNKVPFARTKRAKKFFLSYPFIGLLNVAVISIHRGMWNSIYDTFHNIEQNGFSAEAPGNCSELEIIDVEPGEKNMQPFTSENSELTCSKPVQDIINKISTYFEHFDDDLLCEESTLGKNIILFRKLCNCEGWLVGEFSLKKFCSLGYGDFFIFLKSYASMLPIELYKYLNGVSFDKFPIEASLPQQLLVALLSQASNNLWDDGIVSKEKVSRLVVSQFPLVSFKITDYGSMECLQDIVRENKIVASPKCILFSSILFEACHNVKMTQCGELKLLKTIGIIDDVSQKEGILGSVTSKDALDTLLRAPMMSDLLNWSHWDLIFAPSLGPLVEWLLNDVNTEELLCLLTKDGKIIRIDQSVTLDSFLEVSLQGSSFQTAVKLLSLVPLYGGLKHVPLALLKCHAQKAFDVILKNYSDNIKTNAREQFINHLNESCEEQIPSESSRYFDDAVTYASRFIIMCLTFLPSEARTFATDVLLSGLQSIIKDAPSIILSECHQTEQRLMIHQIGLSLGILEWVNDYRIFVTTKSSDCTGDLILNPTSIDSNAKSRDICVLSNCCSHSKINPASVGLHGHNDVQSEVCRQIDGAINYNVINYDDKSDYDSMQDSPKVDAGNDAALVIESIRREEFGLDPGLSDTESNMLKKQHARLGRALHCLSHELYSQDSHFLLELVQNADDNSYPEDVEPTLSFILQNDGIIILNNERGFSESNIRALCDVGSSTKKGSTAGYIGHKGIGFKSVFRVTDSPEIHSNGFHVKFDISEGQIGFVLPTLVPPCDTDLFQRLLYDGSDHMDICHCWNTSILLPFRSKLLGGSAINKIMSLFSDLHPSLLLFLHRVRCIVFKNTHNDSLIIMRKEVVGDGIVKVSHGMMKMTWYVSSKRLESEFIRPDVKTTEIAIALPLNDTDNGDYSSNLDQQPVFSFLPLRTYGLKFILQGDFVVPSSREEVDGDSPWNQWLLSEFPGLFVGAQRSFCTLPCFRNNPGKAVATYMSFVPLVGEVHGFFYSLPRIIISKLRMSYSVILEGRKDEWVLPCKALRNWDKQARLLLSDNLLQDHLGIGFLNKDIDLPDSLASALGIEEYGPKTLLQVVASLCRTENGLKSIGLGWLCSWINALYTMLHPVTQKYQNFVTESNFINDLKKIPFIPLSDGTYGCVDGGPIWLHSNAVSADFDCSYDPDIFPILGSKLRIVSPTLFFVGASDSTSTNVSLFHNLTLMLHKIGVQKLTAHEIVKVHILPGLSNDRFTEDRDLMTEYVSFVMFHLQSACTNCQVERDHIISELQNKLYLMTNYGCKRLVEVPIHFSKEYANPVDIDRLINSMELKWHEIDIVYLKHPVTKLFPSGILKWKDFFKELGVTDFVHISQVQKNLVNLPSMILKNIMQDDCVVFPESVVHDWESNELVGLLSSLALIGDRVRSIYLLKLLDDLWDDYFSDKCKGHCNLKSDEVIKLFRSSFISNICDFKWVASTLDDGLHHPNDLYHDCDTVHSILGASAPYAVPTVRNAKLLIDIGFKTQVTIDDALSILHLWRRSETPFKASITQMSKFYSYILSEMATWRQKILMEFLSGPCIFVPFSFGCSDKDIISGIFLLPGEVYWVDLTGLMNQVKGSHIPCSSFSGNNYPLRKTIGNIYPGLHDFFVRECGVPENPSFLSYLQYLQQLSSIYLPSQSANSVFRVFRKWASGLRSGVVSSEDIVYFKECLQKLEFTIIPTLQDKWVSLHPSFGLVCWCDDENLRNEMKYFDKVDFVYFGEHNIEEEIYLAEMCVLMKTLGIPALSEVVTREAIYHDVENQGIKASIVNWALPYAQRYILKTYPERYSELELSGFENLNHLQVVVVKKLSYRNVIKACGIASKAQFKCNVLLEGNVLYATQESDSHALYMELSRLFFNGIPDLHFANFLHMITTMAESGSCEDQAEFFILNSQKIPKLPENESIWSLSNLDNKVSSSNQISSKSKKKPRISWPPTCWKNAPGFNAARVNGCKTHASYPRVSAEEEEGDEDCIVTGSITVPDEDDLPLVATDLNPAHLDILNPQYAANDPIESNTVDSPPHAARDRICYGFPDPQQAYITGRAGELMAFKYFLGICRGRIVRWVNEDNETGLPYDIVVEGERKEYIEVKATRSARKDWAIISMREMMFAAEKGEDFSIAHVVLMGDDDARVSVLRDPVRLLEQRRLRLVLMMPPGEAGTA